MSQTPDDPPEHSRRIHALVVAADGDDEALVRACGQEIARTRAYVDRVRAVQEEAAGRLRERGVSMGRISRLAGVSDSYLSRRLVKVHGMARKVIRGPRRY